MKRSHGRGFNVPALVSAFRLMKNGFDVDLLFEENGQIRINRGRLQAAFVDTVGWDYSLRSGATIKGVDGLATEQIRYVIRTLVLPASSSPQAHKTTLFKSRRVASAPEKEADVDRVMKSMERFLVAPLAVPFFSAKKFPRQSAFFQRWLSHHANLGGAYPDA